MLYLGGIQINQVSLRDASPRSAIPLNSESSSDSVRATVKSYGALSTSCVSPTLMLPLDVYNCLLHAYACASCRKKRYTTRTVKPKASGNVWEVMSGWSKLRACSALLGAACRSGADAPGATPEPDAGKGEPDAGKGETVASSCTITGDALSHAVARTVSTFVIEARDGCGNLQQRGGDPFVITIRGKGESLRPKVVDHDNGRYTVGFKPLASGKLMLFVELHGELLPGVPFTCRVCSPVASAPCCLVKGPALTSAIARTEQSFEIRFRDQLNNVAHAEELSVYVTEAGSERAVSEQPTSTSGTTEDLSPNAPSAPPAATASPALSPSERHQAEVAMGDAGMLLRTAECCVTSKKPLVLRETAELGSRRVGQVQPGEKLVILKVVMVSDRGEQCVRASVASADHLNRAPEDTADFESMWRKLRWTSKPAWLKTSADLATLRAVQRGVRCRVACGAIRDATDALDEPAGAVATCGAVEGDQQQRGGQGGGGVGRGDGGGGDGDAHGRGGEWRVVDRNGQAADAARAGEAKGEGHQGRQGRGGARAE